MSIMVPISWGEIFDKITILQIKSERISNSDKLSNVRKELAELEGIVQSSDLPDGLDSVIKKLLTANEKLWDIEDSIRDCERERNFNEEFIRLARAVYYTNDERAALKKQINMLMGSELVEEKSYSSYS